MLKRDAAERKFIHRTFIRSLRKMLLYQETGLFVYLYKFGSIQSAKVISTRYHHFQFDHQSISFTCYQFYSLFSMWHSGGEKNIVRFGIDWQHNKQTSTRPCDASQINECTDVRMQLISSQNATSDCYSRRKIFCSVSESFRPPKLNKIISLWRVSEAPIIRKCGNNFSPLQWKHFV